jgi:hypothetical protein
MSVKNSMLSLFSDLLSFARKDFHLVSYIYTFTLIFSCIALNYSTGFYRDHIRTSYFSGDSVWVFPLFYATFYFAIAIPVQLFEKNFSLLRDYRFYLKSIFFIVLYGMSVGYFGYSNLEISSFYGLENLFIIKILSQLKGTIIFLIPVIILLKTVDKKVDGIYGLSRNSKHIRGYLTFFLLLLPFLVAVSFTSDFQQAYPQFHPWTFDGIFNLPTWVYTTTYEITYAIDFVKTELLFRGMLVIGMISIMGKKAVLPMVAMYAAIHFGKPLGETLSSVFGGYILGALAYQTRHIWGGVIVHICIALSMEVMGFIQYYLLNQ